MIKLMKTTMAAAVLVLASPSKSMENEKYDDQISINERINYPKKICLLKEIANNLFGENHFPAELIHQIIKIDYYLPIEISFPSITIYDLLKLNKLEPTMYTNNEGFTFSLHNNFKYEDELFMLNIKGVFYHQYINNSYLFNLGYSTQDGGIQGWCNFLVLKGFRDCKIDEKFCDDKTKYYFCEHYDLYNSPNFKETKNFEGLKILCYR